MKKAPLTEEKKDELKCSLTSLGSMVVSMFIVPVHFRHPDKKKRL